MPHLDNLNFKNVKDAKILMRILKYSNKLKTLSIYMSDRDTINYLQYCLIEFYASAL